MKYFVGMLTTLGGLVLGALIYMVLYALCMKIVEKIQQRRKLKTLKGKIDKINNLIREIQIEHDKFLVGKAYNRAMHKWIYLHEIQEVELSDKEIK